MEAQREFLLGIKKIQASIIENRKKNGISINEKNFLWNNGNNLIPIPSKLSLKVSYGDRNINVTFTSVQVEDSWERIDRLDVLNLVSNVVEKLSVTN